MSGVRCKAVTSSGYVCLNQAKGGVFCPGHDPMNLCTGLTSKGKPCGRMHSFGTDRCSKHQR